MRKTTFTIIFVATVCVTIMASIAVVAPKAVRAAVATLIRDQDNAARHPWTGTCLILSPAGSCEMPLSAGNEYVIQSVTYYQSGSGFNATIVGAACTTGGSYTNILSGVIPAFTTGPSSVIAYQTFPVTAYCDPGGQGVIISVSANGSTTSYSSTVYANGYYVTLP
jgi:hypothetical protein